LLLAAAVVLALARTAVAQASDEQVRFEVASVKPHVDTGSVQAGIEESESFVRIVNLPLRAVIAMAYGSRDFDVIGPAAIDRRAFDITAKPSDGYQRRQLPVALRNLLVDRFMLVAHRDRREGRGYALRVPADGHRLRLSTGPPTFLTGRPGLIAGNSRTISELVPLLSQMVRARVVDETALTGAYDLRLEWTPQLAAGSAAAAPEPDVSIFTAVREQLGLRLEPIKTMVDVVVVESVADAPAPD
jgi:uncharacterized protein (TIGR03435 family)